jgi:hypothetical protein
MQALRERIGVLVAIVQQREEDSKGEIQLVADGEAADSDAALDHLLQLPADASASTIIPALSSSTSGAPLQLRRSSLHSLLLHRSITQHKLQRLRVELSVEREQSARKEKEIEEQWKRLEEMREHLEQLEKEKAKVRSSEEEIGSERKDEEQVREVSSGETGAERARVRMIMSVLMVCNALLVIPQSVAFASDASTSTLLLQLHTAETRVHRLEQANAAFMKRFCAHVLGWSLAVMVVSWIAMQG